MVEFADSVDQSANLQIRDLVRRSVLGLDQFADWSCRVCRLGARMSPQIRLVEFAYLIEIPGPLIPRPLMSAPTTTDPAARAEHKRLFDAEVQKRMSGVTEKSQFLSEATHTTILTCL